MKMLSAAALALFAAAPAFAAPVTLLDFEGVSSFASIDAFYNGGADGAGLVGPALGLTFSGDALGLQNDSAGPYFSNAPSPLGVMAPVGADATLNASRLLIDAFSFFYSSSDAVTDGVQVWSGRNGTGALLASFNLEANAVSDGCTDSPYCHFSQLSATLAGPAQSVTFGNAAGVAAFDNIAVTVPEPASMLLVALALGGLVATRRRA